ncbi:hypothetical protein G9A89_000938 [Geosiphon pyriformis]|nr:hypothetical protein G9A89_000938 [Geosiphon pyriformis]
MKSRSLEILKNHSCVLVKQTCNGLFSITINIKIGSKPILLEAEIFNISKFVSRCQTKISPNSFLLYRMVVQEAVNLSGYCIERKEVSQIAKETWKNSDWLKSHFKSVFMKVKEALKTDPSRFIAENPIDGSRTVIEKSTLSHDASSIESINSQYLVPDFIISQSENSLNCPSNQFFSPPYTPNSFDSKTSLIVPTEEFLNMPMYCIERKEVSQIAKETWKNSYRLKPHFKSVFMKVKEALKTDPSRFIAENPIDGSRTVIEKSTLSHDASSIESINSQYFVPDFIISQSENSLNCPSNQFFSPPYTPNSFDSKTSLIVPTEEFSNMPMEEFVQIPNQALQLYPKFFTLKNPIYGNKLVIDTEIICSPPVIPSQKESQHFHPIY